jgi:hypothetical protein
VDDPALAHPLELAPLQTVGRIEIHRAVRPDRIVAEEVMLDLAACPRDGGGCSSGHATLLAG